MTNIKLFLARVLSVTLTVMMVAPLSAQAAQAISMSDRMTRNKVSTLSDHDIRFEITQAVNASTDTITLAFNNTGAGSAAWTLGTFALANYDLETGDTNNCETATYTDKTLATTAGAGAWGVATSGTTVTFTAPTDAGATEIAANKCVRVLIGAGATAGGAGATVVTNPANATAATAAYEIALAGTFGDTGEIEVPILINDQVTIDATVDTYTSFAVVTSNGADNAINLGELTHTAVSSSQTPPGGTPDNIGLAVDSNADQGVILQVKSTNSGLKSTFANADYTLTSASEILAANQTSVGNTAGYGIQAQTVSPNAGTLTRQSPYNAAGGPLDVGLVDGTFRNIYSSSTDSVVMSATGDQTVNSGNPVYANVYVLAVPAKDTPAADDYTDTLTFRATSTF